MKKFYIVFLILIMCFTSNVIAYENKLESNSKEQTTLHDDAINKSALLAMTTSTSLATSIAGIGTKEAPFLIDNETKLKSISSLGIDKHYKLIADITLTENWIPIGTGTKPFKGSFDGNGHVIKNMKISLANDYIGMFAYIDNAEIKNLGLENVTINSAKSSIGAIAGHAKNSNISKCYATGKITGASGVGGILGYVTNTNIDKCYTSAEINGESSVGGVVGYLYKGTINNCYSKSNVIATSYSRCFGGIVGSVNASTVSNCYSSGKITSRSSYTGGIAGFSYDTSVIKNSIALNSELVGLSDVNRIVGYISGTTLSNNLAYDDMIVKFNNNIQFIKKTNPTNTSMHGQNMSNVYLHKIESYTSIGWDFGNTWTMDINTSEYPILRDIPKSVQSFEKRYGTVDNPYLIYNETDLKDINKKGIQVHYKLMADITLTENWIPIGTSAIPFIGYFDGNGHVIKNMKISLANDYIGMFGYIDNAEIKNLGLENVTINSSKNYMGAIAGLSRYSDISKCYVTGKITGTSLVGGILGYGYNTNIDKCYTSAEINGASDVGGVVGSLSRGTINNCYSESNVMATSSYSGGIVGYIDRSTVSNCYSSGKITYSGSYTGGIVGFVGNSSVIKNNVALNTEIVSLDKVNRIVGYIYEYGVRTTLSNNLAYDDMIVKKGNTQINIKPTNPTHDSTQGKNATSDSLKTQSTYENLNWDFKNVWIMKEYPKLRFENYSTSISPIPVNKKDSNINLVSKEYRNAESASNTWYNKEQYSASKALDGLLNTRWATMDNNYKPVMLSVDFKDYYVFNKIYIKEFKDRTNYFKIEYLQPNTDVWIPFYEGTILGTGANKDVNINNFGEIVTKKVRITFDRPDNSSGGVTISEFQVMYK